MQEYKMDTIRRSTLSQQVLEQIVHLLMSGQLKPGDKLPAEMSLMKQFDVSRPVLREALSFRWRHWKSLEKTTWRYIYK